MTAIINKLNARLRGIVHATWTVHFFLSLTPPLGISYEVRERTIGDRTYRREIARSGIRDIGRRRRAPTRF